MEEDDGDLKRGENFDNRIFGIPDVLYKRVL